MAGMKRALRKRELPIFDKRGLPWIEEPEENSRGVKPAKAANWSIF